jgi:plasmid stability protein
MAQLVVRNLEDNVKALLQRRAARHGHSMEEEVRDILRDAVKASHESPAPLGTRIRARIAAIGLDRDIEPLRGQPARPATFEK